MSNFGNMPRQTAARMTAQWLTVLLTITAWLFLSNHCALALGSTVINLDSETGVCPMHSAPAKGKPQANIPCCKELRAVMTHATKAVAPVARELVAGPDYVVVILMAPPRVTPPLVLLDTGPPRPLSFAESVLQRSVLAHAPPSAFHRV